jgi:DNA-binding NarL/FixJ family response regulator
LWRSDPLLSNAVAAIARLWQREQRMGGGVKTDTEVRLKRQQDNEARRIVETMDATVRLTRREKALVTAVVDGCSNREIARRFGVSEQTVKNQLCVLFHKIGVSSRLALAMHAVRHGIAQERK